MIRFGQPNLGDRSNAPPDVGHVTRCTNAAGGLAEDDRRARAAHRAGESPAGLHAPRSRKARLGHGHGGVAQRAVAGSRVWPSEASARGDKDPEKDRCGAHAERRGAICGFSHWPAVRAAPRATSARGEMKRGLRHEMPRTAAFVDALRDAFGHAAVSNWMRGGEGGWFCARENDWRWCTPGRTCAKCEEKSSEG